ncbi:MAG: hypothetical protein AAF639_05965 [Chloroflexota bacterium]
MASKKNRRRRYHSRFYNDDGTLNRDHLDELFGGETPQVDMTLSLKDKKPFAKSDVGEGLPDGFGQTNAKYLLINYALREFDNEAPFIHLRVCGTLYRRRHPELRERDISLILLVFHQPAPGLLDELGFEPAKYPGVYRSKVDLFKHHTVVILHELKNTLNNAVYKIFARSQKARQDAYKVMMRNGGREARPEMRRVMIQLTSLTEDDFDNFSPAMSEMISSRIGGRTPEDEADPLADLSTDELLDAVDEYLQR